MIYRRLSIWLYRVSTGWVTLLAVIIFSLFTALVLPNQTNSSTTGEDIGSPDLSIYYSADDLYNMAEAYGGEGRVDYIRIRFTFDLIWPVVYTFFLVTTSSWIFQKILPTDNPLRLANLLAVFGMLGDYLENISTSIIMWRFPLTTPVIDWLAGIFTALKWLFISGSFISLLVGLFLLAWQFIKRDKRRVTK